MLHGARVHAAAPSSLVYGVSARLWAGPGHGERREARSGIPGLCGSGHTHRRTTQRDERPGRDPLGHGPRLGTCKCERPTINDYAGTRAELLRASRTFDPPDPLARLVQGDCRAIPKNDKEFAPGNRERGRSGWRRKPRKARAGVRAQQVVGSSVAGLCRTPVGEGLGHSGARSGSGSGSGSSSGSDESG